jgi:hypothetical protein
MRHLRWLLVLLIIPSSGCGPTTAPAFIRLSPDEQARVDASWKNMLTPIDRLDRELLLDVILAYQLHEIGVDRATYEADKDYADGTIHTKVTFDRTKPLDDHFFVEVRDKKKQLVRAETYSGEEVWSHFRSLGVASVAIRITSTTQPTTAPTTEPTPQPAAATQPTDEQLREEWLRARMKQITAATQPAR